MSVRRELQDLNDAIRQMRQLEIEYGQRQRALRDSLGLRRWATIRRTPGPDDEVNPLVEIAIELWVKQGLSYRKIAGRIGVDKDTVPRWIRKHPHEVIRVIDAYGGIACNHVGYISHEVACATGLGPARWRALPHCRQYHPRRARSIFLDRAHGR